MRREGAYIGLGANLGQPMLTLSQATRALAALPETSLVAVSNLYRTRPVGVTEQPDFLNAVVELEVPAGPDPQTGALALLTALKQLETALGRVPGVRWGPRLIDLDLLLFGDHRLEVTRPDGRWMAVPHPQAQERLFVLAPLADIAPNLRPPGWADTVQALANSLSESDPQAVQQVAGWDAARGVWRLHGLRP